MTAKRGRELGIVFFFPFGYSLVPVLKCYGRENPAMRRRCSTCTCISRSNAVMLLGTCPVIGFCSKQSSHNLNQNSQVVDCRIDWWRELINVVLVVGYYCLYFLHTMGPGQPCVCWSSVTRLMLQSKQIRSNWDTNTCYYHSISNRLSLAWLRSSLAKHKAFKFRRWWGKTCMCRTMTD